MAAKGEKHSPLEQFEIIPFSNTEIGGYDISFTNSSLINDYHCCCNYNVSNSYSKPKIFSTIKNAISI